MRKIYVNAFLVIALSVGLGISANAEPQAAASAKKGAVKQYDFLKRQKELIPLEEAALQKLEYIVRHRVGPVSARALYVVRLANGYAAKAKQMQIAAVSNSDQAKLSEANTYFKKAIEKLEWVQEKAPEAVKMDRLLFDLAFYSMELGQTKRAQNGFEKLLAEHPKSLLIPDTALILGDFYFDQKRFNDAEKMYVTAQRGAATDRIVDYANYRMAWITFHRGKVDEAIDQMIKAALINSKGKSEFRDEAINDLITFYSRSGRLGGAYQEVSAHLADGEKPHVLRQFIDKTFEDGVTPIAIELTGLYANEYMPDQHTSQVYLTRIEAKTLLNQPIAEDLQKWGKNFEPGSDLQVLFQKDPETFKENLEIFKKHVSKQSTFYHASAKKTLKATEAAKAEVYYREYIKHFDEPAVQLRFAHFLYEQKRMPEARDRYEAVYPKLEGEEQKGALLQALSIYQEEAFKQLREDATQPLTPAQLKLQALGDDYIKRFSSDPQSEKIEMTLVTMHVQRKDNAASEPRLRAVLEKYPSQSTQTTAWPMLLDILVEKKAYGEILGAVSKAGALDAVKKDKILVGKLNELRKSTRFKQAELELSENKPALALASFEKFILDEKDPALVHKAHWNASVAARKVNDYRKSLEHLEFVRAGFKNMPSESLKLAEQARREILALSVKVGDLDTAWPIAVELGERCRDLKTCAADVQSGATLAQMAGESKKAASLMARFRRLGGKMDPAWALLAAEQGETRWIDRSVKRDKLKLEPQLAARIIEMQPKLTKTLAPQLGNHPLARHLEAEALWSKLEKKVARMNKVKIRGSERNQARQMKKGLELLDQLQEEVKVVVNTKDPEMSLVSLKGVSDAIFVLSDKLREAPVPKRLTKEQIEIFTQQVTMKADQMTLRAKDFESVAKTLIENLKLPGPLANQFVLGLDGLEGPKPKVMSEAEKRALYVQLMKGENVATARLKVLESNLATKRYRWNDYLVSKWEVPSRDAVKFAWMRDLKEKKYLEAALLLKANETELMTHPEVSGFVQQVSNIISPPPAPTAPGATGTEGESSEEDSQTGGNS